MSVYYFLKIQSCVALQCVIYSLYRAIIISNTHLDLIRTPTLSSVLLFIDVVHIRLESS